MAKSADAADLKSAGRKRLWEFKSPSGHHDCIASGSLGRVAEIRRPVETESAMCFSRRIAVVVCTSLLACLPAVASNLVTGNGFGFAVVSPNSGAVTRFYAHPYSFARPDPQNPLSEGIETANFIQKSWLERPNGAWRIG
jgi:hypothetical protein